MTTVDRLQSINTRVSDLDGDIAEFNRQREELAVRYSQNDKTAIKQVAQLDASSEAAVKERSLLVSAMEQLTKLAESEQQAVLDKVERERQSQAANLAKTICDTNSAIDAKLQELR